MSITSFVDAATTTSFPATAYAASTVYEIDPLSDSRWAELVTSHPYSSVFHSISWLKALKRTYGYESVVFTSCSPGTTLTNGVLFCRVKSWLTGNRLVSLPFSDHCNPLANSAAELDELLRCIRLRVKSEGWKYLEIRPTCYQPDFRTGFCESMRYWAHSLDLRMNEQTLFKNFHKDCVQRKIRRAEREKLDFEEGASESLLKKFYELLVITRRRQFLPPHPLSWFRALGEMFGNDLKVRVAYKGSIPIASILTLSHKKSLVYKYGCSDARFHSCGGMMLVLWKAIQEAKAMGIEALDMGRSGLDNRGLVSFKEHWGAVTKPLVYWSCPQRVGTPIGTMQKAILRRVVPVTPRPIVEVVGSVLYRHIG